MAKANSIPPFPADIDRDSFGHWLSGFTDGEGCFFTAIHGVGNRGQKWGQALAHFTIALRDDDAEILRLIQSFFQVGRLHRRKQTGPSLPQMKFAVRKAKDLATVIVPHFETHPLHAKKQRDFLVWKKAVEILHRIKRTKKRGYHVRKWSDIDVENFRRITIALRQTRQYKTHEAILPVLTEPEQEQLFLFG